MDVKIILVLFGLCCACTAKPIGGQKLMIILLDGVRWDYIQRDPDVLGFPRLAKEGVKVNVTPIFPSNSYPNWYSIATGLYAESHQMVANYMYDPKRNDYFMLGKEPNASSPHWWDKAEPIWTYAEKTGMRTAMHYWNGCQVLLEGVKPLLCDYYREYWEWTTARQETIDKMAETIKWFEEKDEHQLAMLYYEGPDAYGHKYGPESDQTRQEMRDTGLMLETFQNLLDRSSIKDKLNLIILSDHGMTDVENSKANFLDDFTGKEDIEILLEHGANAGIVPQNGKGQKLYDNLKAKKADGLNVYLKNEIPEQYHLKGGELTMDLLLVSDLGYIFLKPGSDRISRNISKGIHGYDPYVQDVNPMRTIMYAKGPAFNRGVVGQAMQQVDHYQIFCHILGLTPRPHNGSWDRVKDLLVGSTTRHTFQPNLLFVTLALLLKWSVFYV